MSEKQIDNDPALGHNSLQLTVNEYRNAAKCCGSYNPDPFSAPAEGPWHDRVFPLVLRGVVDLLDRFDAHLVAEHHLRHGKDNDKRPGPNGRPLCHDTLSFWLYYQHHKGNERDKLLGQRYWSVDAVEAWHEKFRSLSIDQRISRRDRRPSLRTLPKGRPNGLVSEHVVPKKQIKELLLSTRDRDEIAAILRLNLCCVVTCTEDGRLDQSSHSNPFDPWQRYRGKDIVLAHNPSWTDTEIEALLRNGLLSEQSLHLRN